jgi:hypothetical protein
VEVEVAKEELKVFLSFFKKAKSPCLDKWTIKFYLGFYEMIEEDRLSVIEESRLLRNIFGEINATFIALIPNKNEHEFVDDYRPISLCNSIYKILAKISANRLKKMFFDYIS